MSVLKISQCNIEKKLDVITIGRSSVDLYGTQVGTRLEDMASFQKYIGGSPTNIATGCSRLELKSALITRVGNEHMGRFIREELTKEGVDTSFVISDPTRLTAIVLLGIRDKTNFPLIFYRENCADMAINVDDIDEDFIKSTRCLVVTGTHLSNPRTEAAVLKGLNLARKYGVKTALDIDYRPNLWGLSGHDDGENRFIESSKVTESLQKSLIYFDLIVGTEEEFYIAGGKTNIIHALRNVRKITDAVLVCKRGPLGANLFSASIPNDLSKAVQGKNFKIEVFNVLGAGDGFMAGLLKGWLSGESWKTALTFGNACGALAVSRHGCTPSYPSLSELNFFLNRPIINHALRNDEVLEQWHWATNRKQSWKKLKVFAFDHRTQFEQMPGANHKKISLFKRICMNAAFQVSREHEGCGILCDSIYGENILSQVEGRGLWIGRPAERAGFFPLELEPLLGCDTGGLSEWSINQVVKLLCFYHPSDRTINKKQEETVKRIFSASRRNRLEFLLEILPLPEGDELSGEETASVIKRFYEIGVYPDWWKLKPTFVPKEWEKISTVINENDPNSRGILILGLDSSLPDLEKSFKVASSFELVKGFAVGRSIFGEVAKLWMKDLINESDATMKLADRFSALCELWENINKKA